MSRQMQAKSTIRGVASGAVAYRGSREGPRDIVFVPMWSKNCELMPELPSMQGWVDGIEQDTRSGRELRRLQHVNAPSLLDLIP
jgi:hypothetical protein